MSDWIDRPDPLPDPLPAPPEPAPYDPGQFAWQPSDPDPLPPDPLQFPEPVFTPDPGDPDLGYLPPADTGWVSQLDDPGGQELPRDDDAAQVAAALSVLDDRDAGGMADTTAQPVLDATAPVEDHASSPGAEDANASSAVAPGDDAPPETTGAAPPAHELWCDDEGVGARPDHDIEGQAMVAIGDDATGAAPWLGDEDGTDQSGGAWIEPAVTEGEWAAAAPVIDDPDLAAVDASLALLFEQPGTFVVAPEAEPPAHELWRDDKGAGARPDRDTEDQAMVAIGDDAVGAGPWPGDEDGACQPGAWVEPAVAEGEWAAAGPVVDDPDVAAVDASSALLFEEPGAFVVTAEAGEAPQDPQDRHHAAEESADLPRYEPRQDFPDHEHPLWHEALARDIPEPDDARSFEDGQRAEDHRQDEARYEEERHEAEQRSGEDAMMLPVQRLEDTEHFGPVDDDRHVGEGGMDPHAVLEPEEAVAAPEAAAETPAEGGPFRDATEEEILDAAETIKPAGAMVSDLMLHEQQPEALAALRERDPSIRSRPGRTPSSMKKNPNPGMQSAHVVPQSAMRDLADYDPGEAITRMLPTGLGHAHTIFDQYWQARCAELIESGRETMTVGELQRILGEAALRSGAFSPEEGETVAAMAKLELFVDRGLRAEDELPILGLRRR